MAPRSISIVLPDLCGGGAELVAVNLANAFVRRGYAVDMVLLSATGAFLSRLLPEVRIVDLKVSRMRWAIFPLAHYLGSVRPTVVLAFMWPLTVIALWARTLARGAMRVIVAEHTTWSRSEVLARPGVAWQVRHSMRRFFPKADAIVAVSKGAADDLAQFVGIDRDLISVVYNPVVGTSTHETLPVPENPEAWYKGDHRRVLAVGTLKAIKDYPTLLRAFARLCREVDARLLILGEGDCRASLEALVADLGLAGRVFMPGFAADPRPYYRKADLHVLSSTGEGLGNVIIEALAAGTPVVSTDCPSGPREILDGGKFGRLVPVGDAQTLAAAMRESLESEHDSAALKARAQDFSIDKAMDQYERLLFPAKGIPDGRCPIHLLRWIA